MRDYYFFTSKTTTYEDCFKALSSEIKNVERYGESDIFISGKHRSYLYFNDQTLKDFIYDSQEQWEAFRNRIPFENPCITDFSTYRSIDAKRVVKALLKVYPDLFILINDETDYAGTAEEFLAKEFPY